jgi:hypothetical protein
MTGVRGGLVAWRVAVGLALGIGGLFCLAPAAVAGGRIRAGTARSGARQPVAFASIGSWASVGGQTLTQATTPRLATGLWMVTFGGAAATPFGHTTCGSTERSALVAGSNGSWLCLDRSVEMGGSSDSVNVISRDGTSHRVASTFGDYDQPSDAFPLVFGDGAFAGYLHIDPNGAGQLIQVGPTGATRRLADIPSPDPDTALVDHGVIVVVANVDTSRVAKPVVRYTTTSTVLVYTQSGRLLSTFPMRHVSYSALDGTPGAVSNGRIYVNANHRLFEYSLRGRLVRSWPLRGRRATDLVVFDGFAAYVADASQVRVIRLASGHDAVVLRTDDGGDSFIDGLSLQAPGIVAPLTSEDELAFTVTPQFVAMRTVRAATAG